MTKYILILVTLGAYGYVSDQDYQDQSRSKEYGQVQSIENLSE
jgi:hypothetical protein